jgi:hypothetical protein
MGAADIARQSLADARIDQVAVGAYRIPTDAPESDGTLEWSSTTLVVAHVVQHTRLDSRQAALALLSTIAYPAE